MGKSYDLGPRIGIDGEEEFRKAILNTQAVVNTLGLKMVAVSKQFDKNDKSVENLTAQNKLLNQQIEAQKAVLQDLNKGLDYAKENYGENDKRTQQWEQSVIRAEMKLSDLEKTVKDNNEALVSAAEGSEEFAEGVDEAGDKSEKSGKKLKILLKGLKAIGGVAGKAALTAMKAIGSGAAAAAGGLLKLVNGTREYRSDLSKLEQNSKNANQNFSTMKGHVNDLTALTGEMDSSIEAVSNLMASGFDENGMAKAVDALSGAVVKFPDTLKIEGLADGLQETLATGKAVGPFAELIERMGGDLDEFNAQMANATTEAEKQQVALDWLANSGLAEVSKQYKEANADMLSAADAQLKLDDAMADMATIVEPAVASVKAGAADVLTSLIGMATGAEGAAGDFENNVDALITNVVGMIDGLIPAITSTAQAMIPALLKGIIGALPKLIPASMQLINTLITGVMQYLPNIIDAGIMLVMMLADGVIQNLPLIVEGAMQLVIALALGLAEAMPELIPSVIKAVLTIVQGLLDNIPLLIDAALQLVLGIADGIVAAIPLLMAQAPVLITSLINGLVSAIPMLVQAAIQLITSFIAFITDPANITMLVTMAIDLIGAIVVGLIQAIPQLVLAIPEIIIAMVEAFMEMDWAQLGSDLVDGIGEGVKQSAVNLANNVKDAALAALDGVKNVLGIQSPSTVMRDQVGLMMGYGVAEGILDSGKDIEAAFGQVTRYMQLDADFYGSSGNSSTDYSYDYSNNIENNFSLGSGPDELEFERMINRVVRRQMAQMVR